MSLPACHCQQTSLRAHSHLAHLSRTVPKHKFFPYFPPVMCLWSCSELKEHLSVFPSPSMSRLSVFVRWDDEFFTQFSRSLANGVICFFRTAVRCHWRESVSKLSVNLNSAHLSLSWHCLPLSCWKALTVKSVIPSSLRDALLYFVPRRPFVWCCLKSTTVPRHFCYCYTAKLVTQLRPY